MEYIIDFLRHPIAILFLIAVALIFLAWLKKYAKETPSTADDKILSLVEFWLKSVAGKIAGVKFLFLILISAAILGGCSFKWGPVTAETDNELMMKIENGKKKAHVLMSVKDNPATLNEFFDKINKCLGGWLK